MDIRFKARDWIGRASVEQKVQYFQYQFDGRRWKQYFYLMKLGWNRLYGKNNNRRSNRRDRQDIFVDYKEKVIWSKNSVVQKLLQYDVISFDIFDTLLFRRVEKPTDIFAGLELEYQIADFQKKRIEAEKLARQQEKTKSGSTEVTIEAIYDILNRWNICKVSFLEKELEMEKQNCYANPVMLALVNTLSDRGKRVIAVSDMYLHLEQIKELLQNSGYQKIEKIYVSCEYKASKNDGTLFPLLTEQWGKEKTVLHIGDNFYSDVFRNKTSVSGIHYIRDGG